MSGSSNPADVLSRYRMPAEWGPHQCTWISWPHNRETWPGNFDRIEPLMADFVAVLSADELVRINVLDEHHEQQVKALLAGRVASRNIAFHRFATNDAWCRDHGAIFVTRPGAEPLLALDFQFNSWGNKYPPFDLDNAIAEKMASALNLPCRHLDCVLEGGSVDVNGAGALITTEQCLLNGNRNPALSQADIETVLTENLGVDQIIWLADGIVGDDTDGHVDDLTRFVAADTVVTMVETNPDDDNYEPLLENRERLEAVTLAGDRRLSVIELQMPQPLEYQGARLPASYANFYIGNRVVVMPAFNDPADEPNRKALSRCFPERRVVALDCTDLVVGLGAFHCLTQQVPVV